MTNIDTTKQYAEDIKAHADRPREHFLYSGINFQQLAHFLQPVISKDASQSSLVKRQPCPEYVSLLEITSSGDTCVTNFDAADQVPFANLPLPKKGSAHMVFVRGHLSPEWLATLGCKYPLDPEFFRRHFDFMNYKNLFDLPALPSASRNIVRLRIPTICTRSVPISLEDVKKYRRGDLKIVEKFQKQLLSDGRIGDSIIRNVSIHNEKDFTVQQDISICIKKKKHGGWIGKVPVIDFAVTLLTYFTAVILLDSGRDIDQDNWNTIIGGSSHYRRNTNDVFPVIQHKEKLALQDLPGLSPNGIPNSKIFAPSICLLPQHYGFSLDTKTMEQDAIYALSELFGFAACAENQFLNFIKAEVVDAMKFVDGQEETSLANLRFNKAVLDDHMEHILTNINCFEARGDRKWPQIEEPHKDVDEVLKGLVSDFDHLYKKAQALSGQCNQGMSTILNSSMLQESRRAIEQAKGTKRLTVLAFLFVPVSMVASVFGMNVIQLGQGKLQLWVPFVVLVPVLAVSALLCFWNEVPWGRSEIEQPV